jgi:hypothetical protein
MGLQFIPPKVVIFQRINKPPSTVRGLAKRIALEVSQNGCSTKAFEDSVPRAPHLAMSLRCNFTQISNGIGTLKSCQIESALAVKCECIHLRFDMRHSGDAQMLSRELRATRRPIRRARPIEQWHQDAGLTLTRPLRHPCGIPR